MNQQQETRRAAAEAFFESLEQLQQSLESADQIPESLQLLTNQPTTNQVPPTDISLNAWEEAIADIDQFMQQSNPENRKL